MFNRCIFNLGYNGKYLPGLCYGQSSPKKEIILRECTINGPVSTEEVVYIEVIDIYDSTINASRIDFYNHKRACLNFVGNRVNDISDGSGTILNIHKSLFDSYDNYHGALFNISNNVLESKSSLLFSLYPGDYSQDTMNFIGNILNLPFNISTTNLWTNIFSKFKSVNSSIIRGSRFNTIGDTSQRPPVGIYDIGFCYFDTTIKKPIWWTDTKWIDGTGATV